MPTIKTIIIGAVGFAAGSVSYNAIKDAFSETRGKIKSPKHSHTEQIEIQKESQKFNICQK